MGTGSLDRMAKIWEVSTGHTVKTLIGHTGCVNSVAVFSDGVCVLTGSGDKTAKVWTGLLRKAPLQLEAELDAGGAFNITCTMLGGEEIAHFLGVDTKQTFK